MSGIQLGPRLSLVASYVPEKSYLGDIGTDHAYLPIYLWEQGKIIHAVAVDVHEGPYKSALSAIQSRKLESVIEVRFGDGLKPVKADEVDTLTLAGMGGNTMLEIFAASSRVMAKVDNLILQPQGAERKVRLTLLQDGWRLAKEELVEEDSRIYVVMKYSRDEGKTYEELEDKLNKWAEKICKSSNGLNKDEEREILNNIFWDLGPLVLDQPSLELKILIEEQIKLIERTTREMGKSNKEEVQEKIKYIRLTGEVMEGLKSCLFPSA